MALTVGELRVELEARLDNLQSGLRRAQTRINSFTGRATSANATTASSFRGVAVAARSLLPLFAILAGAAGAGSLLELAEASTNLRNRLRLVTDDAEDLETVFGALREVSNDARVSFEATANLFNRLAFSTRDLNISQRELVDLTETISQTLAISGASAEQAQNGLLQFGQALAGGVLRAEEFNSIIENIPALAREIAAGFGQAGISVGRLRQLVLEGAVSAEDLLNALRRRAPEIREQFGQIAPTVAQAFQVARNEILVTVDALNQSTGATSTFAEAVLNASEGLADQLVRAIQDALRSVASLVRGVADVIDTLENLGVTSSRIQGTFRTLFAIIDTAIQSIQAVFRSVLVVLNGLIAAAKTAGALVGAIDVQSAIEATDDFGASIDALGVAGDEAGAAVARIVQLSEDFARSTGQGPDTALSDGARELANRIAASADGISGALDRIRDARARLSTDAAGGAAAQAESQLTTEQENALERILRLEERRNLERLRGVDPLLAQRQELESQIRQLQRVEGPQAVIEARDRVIANLRREQVELADRQVAATERLPIALEEVRRRLESLRGLDPEVAREFSDQLEEGLGDAIGGEAQLERVLELGRAASEALIEAQEERAPSIGQVTGDALRAGIEQALTSGDLNGVLDAFGASLRESAAASLVDAFSEATDALGGFLDNVLPDSFGSLGGAFSGVLGAAIGAALQDDRVTTSVGNVQSAVTSAQQVRGVIAGPTEIGVAQVGRAIQDAFIESERLLGLIARNTATTARNTARGLGTDLPPDDSASLALANESPSLI